MYKFNVEIIKMDKKYSISFTRINDSYCFEKEWGPRQLHKGVNIWKLCNTLYELGETTWEIESSIEPPYQLNQPDLMLMDRIKKD